MLVLITEIFCFTLVLVLAAMVAFAEGIRLLSLIALLMILLVTYILFFTEEHCLSTYAGTVVRVDYNPESRNTHAFYMHVTSTGDRVEKETPWQVGQPIQKESCTLEAKKLTK